MKAFRHLIAIAFAILTVISSPIPNDEIDHLLQDPTTQQIKSILSSGNDESIAQLLSSKNFEIYYLMPDVLEQLILKQETASLYRLLNYPQFVDWKNPKVDFENGFIISPSSLDNVLNVVESSLAHYPDGALAFSKFLISNQQSYSNFKNNNINILIQKTWKWIIDCGNNEALETFLSQQNLINRLSHDDIHKAYYRAIGNDMVSTFDILIQNPVVNFKINDWKLIMKHLFSNDLSLKTNHQQPHVLLHLLSSNVIMAKMPVKALDAMIVEAAERNDYTVMNGMLSNQVTMAKVTSLGLKNAIKNTIKRNKDKNAGNIAYLYVTKIPTLDSSTLDSLFLQAVKSNWSKVIYELAQGETLQRISNAKLDECMVLLSRNHMNLVIRLLKTQDKRISDAGLGSIFVEGMAQERIEFIGQFKSNEEWKVRLSEESIASGIQQVLKNGKNENTVLELVEMFLDDNISYFTDADIKGIYLEGVKSRIESVGMLVLKDKRIVGRVPIDVMEDSRRKVSNVHVKDMITVVLKERGYKSRFLVEEFKDGWSNFKNAVAGIIPKKAPAERKLMKVRGNPSKLSLPRVSIGLN